MSKPTDQQRAESFRSLWSRSMHWVYNDMAEAVQTWKRHGINSLPAYTEGAAALLADDLAKNEVFMASIRAKLAA